MNDLLALDNQLCFRFYRINKLMNRMYAPLLKELGLTYPQYLVMMVLWGSDKPVSVSDIGEALDLDSGTLSPLLKRMESNEIISRVRSVEDERTVMILLTEHGKSMKQQAACIPEAMLAKTGLGAEEFIQLKATLDTLIAGNFKR